MREILFRGKRVSNGEWVYGNYAFTDNNGKQHFVFQNEAFVNKVIPETVGQYTGKMDKNGTKIFEGDVIAYDNNRYSYIVRWDEERCGFYAKMREFDDYDYLGNFWSKLSEIIGNIHDNPELLGGNYCG